jgi:nucleoside-diphosphate-sugar epimerase
MEDKGGGTLLEGVRMVRSALGGRAKLVELPWSPTDSFEFTFAQDAAAVVLNAIEGDLSGFCNVGQGRCWSGTELLSALKAASGFAGVMHFQREQASVTKPKERYLDVTRLAKAGQSCSTSLVEGFRALLSAPTRHSLGGSDTTTPQTRSS